jgi:hypothetical protein
MHIFTCIFSWRKIHIYIYVYAFIKKMSFVNIIMYVSYIHNPAWPGGVVPLEQDTGEGSWSRPDLYYFMTFITRQRIIWKIGLIWIGIIWIGIMWIGIVWVGLMWIGLIWIGLITLIFPNKHAIISIYAIMIFIWIYHTYIYVYTYVYFAYTNLFIHA